MAKKSPRRNGERKRRIVPEAPSRVTRPGCISADKLCQLTGLTDRRHRQLATAGCFPPPYRGQYELSPTLQGLFKHFRELLAHKSGKKESELELLAQVKREIAEFDLSQKRGLYILKSEIGPALRNLSLHQRAVLQFKLENEVGPNLAGLHILEIRAKLAIAADQICELFRAGISAWMD